MKTIDLLRAGRPPRLFTVDNLPDIANFVPAAQPAGGNKHTTEEMHMDINIGIEETDRAAIAEGLSRLLADSYTLYLKTHNFHWNVTGPMFNTLHLMFETQYTELALAVDQIAERIRALGFPAPGSYADFARLSSIREAQGVPAAEDMIRELVEGQEAVVRTARATFPDVDRVGDEPSADLLTQRMQVHEKNAWMLRSML
jgi:starvation-inducible DNA-binding protein